MSRPDPDVPTHGRRVTGRWLDRARGPALVAWAALALVALALVGRPLAAAAGSVPPAAGVELPGASDGATTPPGSADPADVTSRSQAVAAARRAVDDAVAARQDAERHVAELEDERARLASELGVLDDTQEQATRRLETARRHARELVVEAYVQGGGPSAADLLANLHDANDLAWRRWVLHDQGDRARVAVDELARTRQGVRRDVDDLSVRLDRNRAAREQAANDLDRARTAEQEAGERLRLAEEATALRVVRGFRGAGDDGSPTPEESGNAKGPGWDALRRCESSGNYNVISAEGTYRGAYQFDLQTWRSVGGEGDPIDNTTAEQDLRAQILYDQRGAQPWPICGRHLIAWKDYLERQAAGGGTGTTEPPPAPPPTRATIPEPSIPDPSTPDPSTPGPSVPQPSVPGPLGPGPTDPARAEQPPSAPGQRSPTAARL